MQNKTKEVSLVTRKKNQPVRRDTSVVLHVLLVVLLLVVQDAVVPLEATAQLHMPLHHHHHHLPLLW